MRPTKTAKRSTSTKSNKSFFSKKASPSAAFKKSPFFANNSKPAGAPKEPIAQSVIKAHSGPPQKVSKIIDREKKSLQELSELRRAVLSFIGQLDGKAVGDPAFEKIIKQKSWNRIKKLEGQETYYRDFLEETNREALVAEYPGKKKKFIDEKLKIIMKGIPKVPIYTTCITTLSRVLHSLHQHKLKNWKESYGPLAKRNAIKHGAWHEAKPNMSDRPERGDIYLLTFKDWRMSGKEKRLRGLKYMLNITKKSNWKPSWKQLSIAKYEKDIAKTKKDIADLKVKIREEGEQRDLFYFKHVGFIDFIESVKDKEGQSTGMEYWHTIDGGQTVNGVRGGGVEKSKRLYDPKTNILLHPKARFKPAVLKGWVNIDKIMKAKPNKKG